jgi:hypothetical protein
MHRQCADKANQSSNVGMVTRIRADRLQVKIAVAMGV